MIIYQIFCIRQKNISDKDRPTHFGSSKSGGKESEPKVSQPFAFLVSKPVLQFGCHWMTGEGAMHGGG